MSDSVRAGLGAQLQAGTFADVVIRFTIECPLEQQQQQWRRRQGDGSDAPCAASVRYVGDPLPAHRLVLTLGSSFFKARLEHSCWQGAAAAATVDAIAAAAETKAVPEQADSRQDSGQGAEGRTAAEPLPAPCVSPVAEEEGRELEAAGQGGNSTGEQGGGQGGNSTGEQGGGQADGSCWA